MEADVIKSFFVKYSRKKNGARKSHYGKWLQAIYDLIFPKRCRSCGVLIKSCEDGYICDLCFEKFIFLKEPHCPVCGLMFLKTGGDSHKCGECRSKPPYFSRARSVVRYSDDIGKLIHQFKFNGDLSLLATFAILAEKSLAKSSYRADYIVPVPLHGARIKERGFNQSALLAKVFFKAERHKICHLLERIKNSTPRIKLDGVERRQNLRNCFRLVAGSAVKDKVIYIVDDVYTTGTTVNECAKVLVKAGARRVEVFTLAMVIKENAA